MVQSAHHFSDSLLGACTTIFEGLMEGASALKTRGKGPASQARLILPAPRYHVTRRAGKDQSRPALLIYIVDCRVLISASRSFHCATEVDLSACLPARRAQAGNAQAGNLRQGMRGAAGKKALLPFAMNPPLSEPTLTQTRRHLSVPQSVAGRQTGVGAHEETG